jgi:hypothetical protein
MPPLPKADFACVFRGASESQSGSVIRARGHTPVSVIYLEFICLGFLDLLRNVGSIYSGTTANLKAELVFPVTEN